MFYANVADKTESLWIPHVWSISVSLIKVI